MRSQAKTLRRLPNSPPRSSRLAWRQGPPGSKQHLALAAPATRTRPQRPRKYLAIHAAELVVEPNFQILRRYRRPLLLRLEHTHRPALENHVHRATRLGSSRSLKLRIGMNRFEMEPLLYDLPTGFGKKTGTAKAHPRLRSGLGTLAA